MPIYNDVRNLNYDGAVDVITGGFPCQDISRAGSGEGLEGKRSGLWTEFKRIISLQFPKYVIIENVTNLRSKGLSTIIKDLWELGYDAEWHVIPARKIGAEHRRDRLWIIADSNSRGRETQRINKGLAHVVEREKDNLLQIKESSLQLTKQRWLLESRLGRIVDDVPSRMDRLKSLGNAVVPQIPEMIGCAILEAEKLNSK